MKELFEWSVKLDGEWVRVEAGDRLEASKKAAAAFGVRWAHRAREMEIIKGPKIRRRAT